MSPLCEGLTCRATKQNFKRLSIVCEKCDLFSSVESKVVLRLLSEYPISYLGGLPGALIWMPWHSLSRLWEGVPCRGYRWAGRRPDSGAGPACGAGGDGGVLGQGLAGPDGGGSRLREDLCGPRSRRPCR